MSDCRLVNAYGEVANEETQLNQLYLLKDLLIQIKILNEHMAKLSDERISPEDVVAEGEISQ
jgi:hypothetical protein